MLSLGFLVVLYFSIPQNPFLITLSNQNLLFCRVPINSILGFLLRAYTKSRVWWVKVSPASLAPRRSLTSIPKWPCLARFTWSAVAFTRTWFRLGLGFRGLGFRVSSRWMVWGLGPVIDPWQRRDIDFASSMKAPFKSPLEAPL